LKVLIKRLLVRICWYKKNKMLSHCNKVAMTYVLKKFTEKNKYLIFKINIIKINKNKYFI